MIRVGIIDDSTMVRSILKRIIDSEKDFKVVWTAGNVYDARSMILEKKPDVITLDIEMPGMDGLTFLKKLMKHYPLPVIIVSSFTTRNSELAICAMEEGAVEVIGKPGGDQVDSVNSLKEELLIKLRALSYCLKFHTRDKGSLTLKDKKSKVILPPQKDIHAILIGSSTGGVKILLKIFRNLPEKLPPVIIVQHMPSTFTREFAKHLNKISMLEVREARDNDLVDTSQALVAPGNYHILIHQRLPNGKICVKLDSSEKVNFQRPAIDPLFISAAAKLKNKVVGIVLTGMGKDGLTGAKALENAEATILVQDAESCTVYGMPRQVREHVKSSQEILLSQLPSILARTVQI